MKRGAFTFVLHSHLPYCRIAGRWPHGEEWIHEAAVDTYLPLLLSLYRLRDEGVPFRLTLGITPILTEQLADPLILEHLEEYLEDQIRRARSDVRRFGLEGDYRQVYNAQFYRSRYQEQLDALRGRFGRSIVGAFRQLQDEGFLEIITSAATHGYLPLLARDSSIYGQLRTGVDSYRRHYGRDPRAMWLPECAYRPGYFATEDGAALIRPGIEEFLEGLNIRSFFAETHLIEGGGPVGKAEGDAIGPYRAISRRYATAPVSYREPTHKTTFQPYWVQNSEVAVYGRNNRTGMQVWSAQWGYPGDYNYREFHKKDGISGLNYWKVTGADVDLAWKDYYDPVAAATAANNHAAHFAA
ncbi:MAG: 1,4-alpha-glucan branching protein, partial [Chloroflexi bacterium]|nr:1,4-alpha-glucan branching protein [Chloroflexota bacterium]